MPPSPAGLAPMKGIPMVAQAVLHREILHVHALLELILGMLRSRLAITSTPISKAPFSPNLTLVWSLAEKDASPRGGVCVCV